MGHYEYGLKSLADEQLLSGLARIVQRRNEITAEFLAYLAELDERQLFLDLGFSSLFEYCTVKLGLCGSTAGRHIAAARVCRSHPQVFEMVASGALHASALSLLKKHLTGRTLRSCSSCVRVGAHAGLRSCSRRAFRGRMSTIWCVACLHRRRALSTSGVVWQLKNRRASCRPRRRRRPLRSDRRPSNNLSRRHRSSRCHTSSRSRWVRRRRLNPDDRNPCPRIALACISRRMVSSVRCWSACAGSRGIGCRAAI